MVFLSDKNIPTDAQPYNTCVPAKSWVGLKYRTSKAKPGRLPIVN